MISERVTSSKSSRNCEEQEQYYRKGIDEGSEVRLQDPKLMQQYVQLQFWWKPGGGVSISLDDTVIYVRKIES